MSSQQIHGGRRGGGPKEREEENGSVTRERTAGMESLTKGRMDDLLSAEVGKQDYDWLLTPPGTPLCSSSEAGGGSQAFKAAPKSKSNARSVSTGKASRLSAAQTERDNSGKSCRSNSTSRSSISNAYSSSPYLSSSGKTAVLNTSTASVTSKPSSPGHRSLAGSTARAPSSPSRLLTPAKTRPLSSSAERPRPSSQNSRPSTPTARPQAAGPSSSSNAAAARSASRPSTPSRRAPVAGASPALIRSSSVGHAPAARPSSPLPRARAQAQASPDRQPEAPPNARTRPRDQRPVSAGRQRPGTPSPARANSNPETVRRQSSSPVVTKGRLQESSSNARSKTTESRKPAAAASESSANRRPIKPASSAEKSISKKPTDAKQNAGGIRGTSLFPQSIRAKGRSSELPARRSDKVDDDGSHGIISRGCNGSANEHNLLKDDSKNRSRVHGGIDGKCDRSPLFDYRLGALPEPYGLL